MSSRGSLHYNPHERRRDEPLPHQRWIRNAGAVVIAAGTPAQPGPVVQTQVD